jgi:predicted N-acetyltransferase YhbS
MVTTIRNETLIRNETPGDVDAREALLDRVWGAARFEKTAERLREGRTPAPGLAFVAEASDETLVGTVRLWHVCAGPTQPALLLGPLAVDESQRGRGVGGALMQRALASARRRGNGAVILVGDPEYYERFGFSAAKTGALWLPGPFERHRLLGCELVAGALDGASGLVGATGRPLPTPSLAVLIANLAQGEAVGRQAA